MTYTTQWDTILDAEILAVRRRHAAQLAAEHATRHAKIVAAIDAEVVALREARVLARRGHELVRALVEP